MSARGRRYDKPRPLGEKRLAVLRLLATPRSLGELAAELGETRSAVESHVRELTYRSLVERESPGRMVATTEGRRLALSVALLGMRSSP